MEDKVIEKVEEKIQHILDEDININNLDNLVKLSKIKHYMKEDKDMYYGNYGARRPGYDSYGRDDYGRRYYGEDYGRRGRDMKYRGDEHLDRMGNEYGRYMESRARYGHNEETDKSFEYMVKSLEDFIRYLHEEADTPQEHQMLNEVLQRSMR